VKDWLTWLLVLVGLAYVISAHTSPPTVALPEGAAAIPRNRAAPYDKPAAPLQPPAPSAAFGGYPCAGGDCTQDIAGYRWARQDGIIDPDDCTGNSGAFIEGCRVYAQQRGTGDSAATAESRAMPQPGARPAAGYGS